MARKRVKPRTYWRGGSIAASMLGSGEAVVQSTDERTEAALWPNGTVVAESASQAHVAAAVSAAVDGQRVLIPNGTATWSSGITTTKQILIRAQNYTPTEGGSASRSVTITNNLSGSGAIFSITSGDTYHCGVAGIAFLESAGERPHISVHGDGGKVPLVSDCTMECGSRFWPNTGTIVWESLGGVLWNIRAVGTDMGNSGAGFLVRGLRAWTTASTMGTLDTDGDVNVYAEDSTFMYLSQWPDIEDNGRYVCRYSTLNGTWGLTHGFTSSTGGRHFEYYNNTFSNTVLQRDIAARYFWCRAGTGLFTDNVVNNAQFPSEYGAPIQLAIGDNTEPSSTYPQFRQPGWGHNGSNHVSDPIYIWSQSGARAYTWNTQGGWDSLVHLDRDIFVDDGAKPGYSKYTYPHPLRYA